LLSYITTPFQLSADDPGNLQFSNFGIARNIVRALDRLGYIVDVVEYLDTKFLPRKDYDLFVGHGGFEFEHISRNLPPDAVRIYFSTGIYWKDFNRQEEERFRWLEERRGVRLPYDRWIYDSEEYANQSADGIICLGNQVAKDSYSQFGLVINLNNAAYHESFWSSSRPNFLRPLLLPH
jgi:hypothetical protein